MNSEPPKEILERRKLGLELRQKYELYFVALAFTLAGLSVQTAQGGGPSWRMVVEISGWAALLVVGLLGLWRVSGLWRREVGVAEYQERQYDGTHKEFGVALEKLEGLIRKLEKAQYTFLIFGIGLLMISRATKLLVV